MLYIVSSAAADKAELAPQVSSASSDLAPPDEVAVFFNKARSELITSANFLEALCARLCRGTSDEEHKRLVLLDTEE